MTMADQGSPSLQRLKIRTFQTNDQPHVSRLYNEGLLEGQLPPHDTAADIDNIFDGYLSDPSGHFWVADLDGHILGMIGVANEGEHIAEIRRLRVDQDWQNTPIAERLIETALAHCREHGYLKVVFDTRFERTAALQQFDRFGFQYTRSKSVKNKELLEFYLDLYRQTKDEE